MKKLFYTFLICVPVLSFAQKETRAQKLKREAEQVKKMQKESEPKSIIYTKQNALNLNFNSDGFSLGFENATFKSIKKSNLWWFNLGERKNTKEEKITALFSNGSQAGNPYVFGKQNNFYYLKLGFGKQVLLGGKSLSNGVAVSAIYGGGLSLGMLKPYYLEVINRTKPQEREQIKFSESDSRFISPDSIYGASSFGTGFGEMKFVPGAFVKGAVRFDYGKFNDIISAIEVGITAEYYIQKMPIMILAKEKNFFVSGYISLIFGSRR